MLHGGHNQIVDIDILFLSPNIDPYQWIDGGLIADDNINLLKQTRTYILKTKLLYLIRRKSCSNIIARK